MSVEITNNALRSFNPADGSVVGEVMITPVADIARKVEGARSAFGIWSTLSLTARLRFIERFREVLLAHKDELAELITRETGKPLIESYGAEIFGALETCKWLTKHATRLLKNRRVRLNRLFFTTKRAYDVHEPLGVVAVISPWNFPFSIPVDAMLNALAAGNTVVLKPSPKTPAISRMIENLFRETGLPEGVVSFVHGDRAEAAALVTGDVDRVVFTGSVGGGKAIMKICADKVHPLTLELGGKHAAIVLADADVDRAAQSIVWGAFTNAGQACASIERVYVMRSLAGELSVKIAQYARALRLGNGLSPNTDVGPVIDAEQFNRVQGQAADAIAGGACLLTGGKARPELGKLFFEPTILTGVREDMRVMQEEIFGPLLPIATVDTASEAIERANASHLGLGASIWTADTRLGEQMARKLQAGVVWINDGLYSHSCADAPWGGVKASGFGRKGGAAGLLDFVSLKHVSVDKQGVRDWQYPYTRSRLSLVKNGIDACHKGPLGKLWAFAKLIPAWIVTRR